ncbi:PadR family transcriptional regulator [Nonomuraea rubra]|uniref:DNA-binding PadR family transcriptional regulator n=2 Tax=Nonomuraea rubra TaxID=46180 RepID=A0A7X0NV19_9ACTN|nr:helix-turn-helix transcriptional regulator [Nonomuraea rubra]MBB6550179.1 DNA-binding PadR family transcriptional regulator [Nonomuraea rubra]
MAGLERITQPTLDVLETLLHAFDNNEDIHGWAIIKRTKRAGPTVYKALDRLEDAGMITGAWEELGPDQPGPRRRFYHLTGEGAAVARTLLAERRPSALCPKPAFGVSLLGYGKVQGGEAC